MKLKTDENIIFSKNNGKYLIFLLIVIVLIVSTILITNRNNKKSRGNNVVLALSESSESNNFKKATEVIDFSFPRDKGEHPDFQTEWWYYTGNLKDEKNNHYGYQLTFFRRALTDEKIDRDSKWSTNQIYFGHFTVTDVKNKKFYSSEKYNRGSAGLAGVSLNPYKIWLENWELTSKGEKVYLNAKENDYSISLELETNKKYVFHGNKGLSQKSSEIGNASYYYSQTSLKTNGEIKINNESFNVNGLSWLDREWSTSVLSKEQKGWDWFSLQLDNKSEIMLYQLRLNNNKIDENSSGTFIDKNGNTDHLNYDDYKITVLNNWTSQETGITYPSEWEISIPKYNLKFNVIPYQNNQELNHSFIYWEGAVKVVNKDISGNGYVELTGYDNQ